MIIFFLDGDYVEDYCLLGASLEVPFFLQVLFPNDAVSWNRPSYWRLSPVSCLYILAASTRYFLQLASRLTDDSCFFPLYALMAFHNTMRGPSTILYIFTFNCLLVFFYSDYLAGFVRLLHKIFHIGTGVHRQSPPQKNAALFALVYCCNCCQW